MVSNNLTLQSLDFGGELRVLLQFFCKKTACYCNLLRHAERSEKVQVTPLVFRRIKVGALYKSSIHQSPQAVISAPQADIKTACDLPLAQRWALRKEAQQHELNFRAIMSAVTAARHSYRTSAGLRRALTSSCVNNSFIIVRSTLCRQVM